MARMDPGPYAARWTASMGRNAAMAGHIGTLAPAMGPRAQRGPHERKRPHGPAMGPRER